MALSGVAVLVVASWGLGEFYTVWKLIPYIKGKNCVPPTQFFPLLLRGKTVYPHTICSLIIKGKNCVPLHKMFPYY